MKQVCLVGATSHIAKALIAENSARRRWCLTLLARSPERVKLFLKSNLPVSQPVISSIEELGRVADTADVIINCVGFGTPNKMKTAGPSLFSVTEQMDEDILGHLVRRPQTKYINFSSGAVYGTELDRPVGPGFISQLELSPMKEADFYRISKIHQEAKHRAHKHLSILDIRLFSFFSRYLDRDGGYLMNDVINSLSSGKPLLTGPDDIYRDFISPADLFNLVDLAAHAGPLNLAVDSCSTKPISKFELLEKLKLAFGLKFEVVKKICNSPTGTKPYYYSINREAQQQIGFHPTATSWDTICQELRSMGLPDVRN